MHYPKVKLVVDEIVLQSMKVGFDYSIVKDNIITLEQEALMLVFFEDFSRAHQKKDTLCTWMLIFYSS